MVAGYLPVAFIVYVTQRVCYDFDGMSIGCFRKFDNTPCWPEDPNNFNIEFRLFTREFPNTPTPVTISELDILDAPKPTKFILHGYRSNCDRQWIGRMKDELLAYDDYNVFCVDFSKAVDSDHEQAVANARVVGAAISVFIDEMTYQVGIHPSDVHIIGQSLGAHVAGYAGQRSALPISRISGLDPAGPRFQGTPPSIRLDPSDALFVDVIHTDGLDATNPRGLGILQASGHVDFYPNLGRDQPGCPSQSQVAGAIRDQSLMAASEVIQAALCDHLRGYEYYIESINSRCAFTAIACSLADAEARTCHVCGSASCTSSMGFDADLNQTPGSYFLTTNAMAPFCVG